MTTRTQLASLTLGFLLLGLILNAVVSVYSNAADIEVRITVEPSPSHVRNIVINNVDISSNSIVTYNSRNTIEAEVAGAGLITISDNNTGVEYYSYNKTDASWSQLTAYISLGTVGTHSLELAVDYGNDLIVTTPFTMEYSALPLPPNAGARTGYTYIGGYAINNLDLIIFIAILGIIGVFIFTIVRNERNDHKVEAEPSRPRRAKSRIVKPRK